MQPRKFLLPVIMGYLGTLAGLILLAGVAMKAWMDMDPTWDSWWYHIPFAARMWDIVPAGKYEFEWLAERYYDGLPRLGEWLMGLFWLLTGHIQATNFVCFLSLLAYVLFLNRRFGINLGLAAFSLLAVPLVMAHAVSSYVDLPGNLALSAIIMIAWKWVEGGGLSRIELAAIAILAMAAANMKPQMIPPVFLLAGMALAYGKWRGRFRGYRPKARHGALLLLVCGVILCVPLKNGVTYGNILYPLELKETKVKQAYVLSPKRMVVDLVENNWLRSLLELSRPYGKWSVDQLYFTPWNKPDRLGGLNGVYVVAQLLLFTLLMLRQPKGQRWQAPLALVVIMLAISRLPGMLEQRYYMFWFIWIISFNLMLIKRMAKPGITVLASGVNLSMFLVAGAMTHGFYLWPQGVGMHEMPMIIKKPFGSGGFSFVPNKLHFDVLDTVEDGDTLCLVQQQPFTFLYSEHFHPGKAYKVVGTYNVHACPVGSKWIWVRPDKIPDQDITVP